MSLKFLSNQTTDNKIGIGTNVLNYTLAVYGSSVDSEIVASFGSANDQNEYTAIGLSGFIASNGATKAGLALKRTSTYGVGELHFLNNNTTDNSDMTLSDSKMVILGNGNVGIGTNSPAGKLTIADTAFTTAYDSIKGLFFDNSNISSGDENFGAGIEFGKLSGNGNLYKKAAIIPVQSGADSDQMGISFFVSNSTGQASPVIEAMRVDYGGNVGIGTTGPNQKLSVKGIISSDSNDDYYGAWLSGNSTAGSENYLGLGPWYSQAGYVKYYDNDRLSIYTYDATEDVTLQEAGGNVGIGVTGPNAKLHVDSSTAFSLTSVAGDTLFLSDDTGGSSLNGVGASIGFSGPQEVQRQAAISALRTGADHDHIGLAFYTHPGSSNDETIVEQMRITDSGNVGIGTDSPTQDLTLYRSSGDTNFLISSNNGASQIFFGDTESDNIGKIDYDHSDNSLNFAVNAAERMRITNLGGISFGSTGTAYGTSGQVLTSAGNASPTWITPTTGTVTGNGSATQVAFWDGTNSLSGDQNLYWDSTEGHLGINDSTPGSPLKVYSGTTEDSIYTVDINHVRNNADIATHAMRLNVDFSGADTTTADRVSSALVIDLDSSADGDASDEHRIRGVNSDVRFTGFSDSVQSGYFLAESNNSTEKTALLMGLQAQASHDSSSTNGGVSNMYGVYGVSSIQDLGQVTNAYGGLFIAAIPASRGAANVGTTKGVAGKVTIDTAETITYGEMMAVSGIIDNNEGTVPTFGNQYLFKGDYKGTKGGNAYGIYTEGDKHYFDGNIGIRTSNALSKLTVGENGITTKIATATIADTTAGASLTLRGGSPTIYFDRTGADPQNKILMDNAGLEFKTGTLDAEGDVDFKINPDGSIQLSNANLSNQENTDIDSAAAEVVAEVAISYTAAFFDFVVKKGTNVRSGTVYACHDGTSVEFTETSTNDLGDTSDVTLSVDKTSTNLRLIATVTSDDWSVKSLIRAI